MPYTTDFTLLDEDSKKYPDIPGVNYNPGWDEQVENFFLPHVSPIKQNWTQQTAPPELNTLGAFQMMQPQAQPPASPQGKTQADYLEPYLQMISQYLVPPKYDEAREKRLQNAALINAVGNAFRHAVNYTAAANGVPIAPIQSQYTLGSLAEAQRMRELQDQRQDLYNRMKTQALMEATMNARTDRRFDEGMKMEREKMGVEAARWKENMALELRKMGLTEQQVQAQIRQMEQNINLEKEKFESQKDYQNKSLGIEQQKVNVMRTEAENKNQKELDQYKQRLLISESIPFRDMTTNATVYIPPDVASTVAEQYADQVNALYEGITTPGDYAMAESAKKNIVLTHWREFFDLQIDTRTGEQVFVPKTGVQSTSVTESWLNQPWRAPSSTTGSQSSGRILPIYSPNYYTQDVTKTQQPK